MLKVSSPEILEYRKAIEERKLDLPIWERKVITCEEAAAYSGIGIKRLRKIRFWIWRLMMIISETTLPIMC